ncbi:MAG: DUF1801 domain-containing protein [Chitinophagales bacterium]
MLLHKPKNIDEYIAGFEADIQNILKDIRAFIRETVPDSEESISYGMPAYKLKGKPLVYFAAFKNHVGLYALPSGNQAFQEELSKYKTGKGSIQFPLKEEMPFELMGKIIAFRVTEIEEQN